MARTEAARHRVYEAFKGSFGEEVAGDVLEMLPPAGVPELATKDDIALVRSDMAAMEARLRLEMAELRAGLRGEMAELREELRVEMAEQFTKAVRVYLGGLAVAVTLLGAVLGYVAMSV